MPTQGPHYITFINLWTLSLMSPNRLPRISNRTFAEIKINLCYAMVITYNSECGDYGVLLGQWNLWLFAINPRLPSARIWVPRPYFSIIISQPREFTWMLCFLLPICGDVKSLSGRLFLTTLIKQNQNNFLNIHVCLFLMEGPCFQSETNICPLYHDLPL